MKLAKVAEGEVDIYPRLAPTSEWDIAAGHAVVTAAGGKVTDMAGERSLPSVRPATLSCRDSSRGAIRPVPEQAES